MGDLPAHSLLRVSHGTAHDINGFLGHKTFKPGDFCACLLLGETITNKDKTEDSVPFYQEFCVPFSGVGKYDAPIGDVGEISGIRKFGYCLGYGRGIYFKMRCDVVCFNGIALLKDELEIVNFSR